MLNKEYKTEIKEFGDLKPGDRIVGSDGQPITVTDVYEKHIPEKMYEIEMEDGEIIQASGNHLWYCETNSDELGKEMYRQIALEYFKNNEIPEKLVEDHHFPLELITTMFGDNINTRIFIEKASRSLGHSSMTPHIMLINKLKDQVVEEILNYSYNNLIDFLHKMKDAILNNSGYFYFGQVRDTQEIAKLKEHNKYVNIPHKKEIMAGK